jgi:hypothetical protein
MDTNAAPTTKTITSLVRERTQRVSSLMAAADRAKELYLGKVKRAEAEYIQALEGIHNAIKGTVEPASESTEVAVAH